MGCIACRERGFGYVPPDIHHLLSGGVRIGHDATIPLCAHHHRGHAPAGMTQAQAALVLGPSLAHVRGGAYRNGPHPNPAIERAVAALGGWRVLAMADDEAVRYIERRFTEHYDSIEEAQATRERLPELAAPATGPTRLRHTAGPRRLLEGA